jgi:hypothetical protein
MKRKMARKEKERIYPGGIKNGKRKNRRNEG